MSVLKFMVNFAILFVETDGETEKYFYGEKSEQFKLSYLWKCYDHGSSLLIHLISS